MVALVGTETLEVLAAQANGQPAASTQTVTTAEIAALAGAVPITDLTLLGSTSGTTQVLSGAIAGTSVLTLPVATDTLVGKATTDALTNKTVNGLIITSTTGTLTIPAGVVLTGPAASGTAATLAGTETLSNKTMTDPIETNTHRSTVQLDKTTDVVLANIVGLVQTVVPGTYQYKINLDTTSTANGGVKAAFKYTTAVASALNSIAKAFDAAAVVTARFVTATDQASILDALAATVACEMAGTIVVTTGGTLQLQFAQNTSHADTSSVFVGSSMTFTRLA